MIYHPVTRLTKGATHSISRNIVSAIYWMTQKAASFKWDLEQKRAV